VFVANQPTLGAGLALPVRVAADDGVCEICVVPRCARVSLALRLAALRTGRPQPEHVLTVRRAWCASIEVERVSPFVADGDAIAIERRFDVVVRPRAVTILC
jgi:diacylglycerol kinase family enzyme